MTRGTWQGSGTFQTGGPDPAAVIAILAVILLLGSGGAAAAVMHAVTGLLVMLAVVVAVLMAAAVAGLFFVWRATRRREAAYAVSERHQRIMAEVRGMSQVPQKAEPPALEQHIHYHYHGGDAREPLRVIRREVEP